MFLHKCGDGAETIWAYVFGYVGWFDINLGFKHSKSLSI